MSVNATSSSDSLGCPARKPKLVFFQCRYDKRLPEFLLLHAREHVRCLSHFFDVTVVNRDGDYGQICEEHGADLSLFELGVNHESCERPRLTNLGAWSQIPKVALHNADSFCNARAGLLSDLEHYGIDTVFAIATTAGEHNPELADRLFAWPNFIDPEVFHDYGQWKSIPVLITGNQNKLYPWRQRVTRLMTRRYPSLICPHPGYEPNAFRGFVLHGESYARTINAASMVPACGTVAKEVVRKHLEIPACNSCLVTERSPALEAAGFVDMENCVFADSSDIVEKVDFLLEHPEELRRITAAGHALVHARHTMSQRGQIREWYELKKHLRAGERIVQPGPFEPIRISSPSSDAGKHAHVICSGTHLELIQKGDRHLAANRIEAASQCYAECLNYMPWMPEPHLRRAICNLRQGNSKAARTGIESLISFVLDSYGANDPDPVEWAYYVHSLLCSGDLSEARQRASQFLSMSHPELDRVRWLVARIEDRGDQTGRAGSRRRTIHVLPNLTTEQWLRHVEEMLRACGQGELADKVTKLNAADWDRQRGASSPNGERVENPVVSGANWGKNMKGGKNWTERPNVVAVRSAMRNFSKVALSRMETLFGPFLPFQISIVRKEAFYESIQDIMCNDAQGDAVIVGAAPGAACTEACLLGASRNENPPVVHCIPANSGNGAKLTGKMYREPFVKWYDAESNNLEATHERIARIMEENSIGTFGAAIVTGSGQSQSSEKGKETMAWLTSARWVLLEAINCEPNWARHHWLLQQPRAELVGVDPGARKGYSIFRIRAAS
jgi:hypothetical protein